MIVHFIATQHSIDINYTYLKKIYNTINQLGHKPSRKWLSKERRFIESINRKDGINWGVFTKKDLEAIGGADLVVAEVTDENIAIGYQIAVAVQQKKPVLMLSRHDISSVSLSSNANPDFDQFVTIKRYDLNTVSGILKGFFEKNDIKKQDMRFNFFINSEIYNYLKHEAYITGKNKSEILRELVLKEIRK